MDARTAGRGVGLSMWIVRIGAGLGAFVAPASEPRWHQRKSGWRIVVLGSLMAGTLAATMSDARADCNPAAGNNVTATCTGTTLNQGANPPPSGAGVDGYGSGVETGLTVNVSNGASVTGTNNGINAADVSVNNGTGATITGHGANGINARIGAATVINSGTISGNISSGNGIFAETNATVTNNAGASITGFDGILARTLGSVINLTNSGSISGTGDTGVLSVGSATVTNNAAGTITGQLVGIDTSGPATVSNFGMISGASGVGIIASSGPVTVTNYAGATIIGGFSGIQAGAAGANVVNFGTIAGGTGEGVEISNGGGTVINGAGASITAGIGVQADVIASPTGTLTVVNSGSITGTRDNGIFSGTSVTVTNNAGGTITGRNQTIAADGAANVINSGVISGNRVAIGGSTVTVTNNAGATITGEITASAGGSAVTNAGSISATGRSPLAIGFAGTGNTLTLIPGSTISGLVVGTGADTLQLGGSGAATFDASQLGSASTLQYQGFGTLNKIDNSVWTLTGTSPYAGAVNVNGSTLVVDGDISGASGLTVNAAGTLAGIGTVGATAVNGGTLAPGDNGVGMLTVKGSLTMTAASTYLVQLSGASNSSVNVTGAAAPGGATVDAAIRGSFVSKQYTILTATGGVSGTFAPGVIMTGLPSFSASLGYDATHAYLNLSPNFGNGLPSNQQAVANALSNSFNSNGGIPLLYGSLTPAALTQASGESATGSLQTTFNAMGQFLGLLTDPFMSRGGGVAGATAPTGYADEDGEQASAYASSKRLAHERDAYAMFTKAPLAKVYEPRWSVWAAGFGGSQSTDGNTLVVSNNTTSSIYGTAVGADYLLSPTTIAGFALAGGGTSFSVVNAGSGRSDLFQAGAYFRHKEGPAYVSAALAYGWQDITTNRTVTIAGLDQLRAEFNANAWSGRVEGGYRFVAPVAGGVGITPYAAGQFTTFELPSYAESVVTGTPNFALAYGAQSITDARSELGIRSDKSFAVQNGVLTLRGRLAWAHDFDPSRAIAATFQALPGASFVVNGAAQASESALTTASVEMKWINGWSAAATFEGEFSDVTRSYAGKGVVRYAW